MPSRIAACLSLTLLLAVSSASPAKAHEFWLEPSAFMPAAGDMVEIRLRNGQRFKGDSYPLVRSWFTRFSVIEGGRERALTGTEGDDPAIRTRLSVPGTAIVVFHGTPDLLTFETWQKFESYLRDEGLAEFAARHRARGLP
ncbi:MAG: DUF4198 domain-containing protein, partial [Pseudomonadota bacterium]|nr:DUF4198 domain-containing protein [Pseudomonadota bacterium]